MRLSLSLVICVMRGKFDCVSVVIPTSQKFLPPAPKPHLAWGLCLFCLAMLVLKVMSSPFVEEEAIEFTKWNHIHGHKSSQESETTTPLTGTLVWKCSAPNYTAEFPRLLLLTFAQGHSHTCPLHAHGLDRQRRSWFHTLLSELVTTSLLHLLRFYLFFQDLTCLL